jgi:hypothetical protein
MATTRKQLDATAAASAPPIPPPAIGVRTALRTLVIATSHRQRVAALGSSVDHIIAQTDMHLTDAVNALKGLQSTAGHSDAAACIAELLERLS